MPVFAGQVHRWEARPRRASSSLPVSAFGALRPTLARARLPVSSVQSRGALGSNPRLASATHARSSSLRTRQATAALALEFTILTAARSGEVLGAHWDEIDLERALWTVAKWIKRDERGFYYSNADSPPARFYFKTSREAVADLAIEIGVTDEERAGVP